MARCPTEQSLRDPLADRRPAPEAAADEAHLEACAACQRALGRLIEAPPARTPDAAAGSPADDAFLDRPGAGMRLAGAGRRAPDETAARPDAPPGSTGDAEPAAGPTRRPAGPFGRYRILGVVGAGGMGTVHRAHGAHLDRPVALKVVRWSDPGPAQVERFCREARIAASFTHPNLCPVYDFDRIDGLYYLTTPLPGGGPLSAVLARGGPWPPEAAARLAAQVARAVHDAHAANVIHRDLKPANIMITGRGQPAVMDFGPACRYGPADARLTAPGTILGTPADMAPEQVAGGPDAGDPTQDVYSLGVIVTSC